MEGQWQKSHGTFLGIVERVELSVGQISWHWVEAVDPQTRICSLAIQGVILPYRHIYAHKNRPRHENSKGMHAETNRTSQRNLLFACFTQTLLVSLSLKKLPTPLCVRCSFFFLSFLVNLLDPSIRSKKNGSFNCRSTELPCFYSSDKKNMRRIDV